MSFRRISVTKMIFKLYLCYNNQTITKPTQKEQMMKENEKIRLLRESKQWSQEEMAEKLGLSITGYAKIERGETRLNLPRLDQIAEVFGLSTTELISFGEEAIFSLYNSDNNLNFSNLNNFCFAIGNKNLENEIVRLQQENSHKSEIIEGLKREIELLNKVILSLEK